MVTVLRQGDIITRNNRHFKVSGFRVGLDSTGTPTCMVDIEPIYPGANEPLGDDMFSYTLAEVVDGFSIASNVQVIRRHLQDIELALDDVEGVVEPRLGQRYFLHDNSAHCNGVVVLTSESSNGFQWLGHWENGEPVTLDKAMVDFEYALIPLEKVIKTALELEELSQIQGELGQQEESLA